MRDQNALIVRASSSPLPPEAGDRRSEKSTAKGDTRLSVVEHHSRLEGAAAGRGQLPDALEIRGHDCSGGLDFNAHNRPGAIFHHKVDFVLILVAVMQWSAQAPSIQVICLRTSEKTKVSSSLPKVARSAATRSAVAPSCAASRPESRKCSLGVFTRRLSRLRDHGSSRRTRNNCSRMPTYFLVVLSSKPICPPTWVKLVN